MQIFNIANSLLKMVPVVIVKNIHVSVRHSFNYWNKKQNCTFSLQACCTFNICWILEYSDIQPVLFKRLLTHITVPSLCVWGWHFSFFTVLFLLGKDNCILCVFQIHMILRIHTSTFPIFDLVFKKTWNTIWCFRHTVNLQSMGLGNMFSFSLQNPVSYNSHLELGDGTMLGSPAVD